MRYSSPKQLTPSKHVNSKQTSKQVRYLKISTLWGGNKKIPGFKLYLFLAFVKLVREKLDFPLKPPNASPPNVLELVKAAAEAFAATLDSSPPLLDANVLETMVSTSTSDGICDSINKSQNSLSHVVINEILHGKA